MLLGMIIDLAVGLLCVVLGILIWAKKKVTLLHDYHYKNVQPSDIPAYTRLAGISLILIGVGICVSGLFHLRASSRWWIPMLVGIVAGVLVMNRAQKKYNGSWFS